MLSSAWLFNIPFKKDISNNVCSRLFKLTAEKPDNDKFLDGVLFAKQIFVRTEAGDMPITSAKGQSLVDYIRAHTKCLFL